MTLAARRVSPRIATACLAFAASLLPATAAAQRPEWRLEPQPLRQQLATAMPAARTLTMPDSVVIPETHWLEGGLIVGSLTATLGVLAGASICNESETGCSQPALKAVGAGLVLGVLGFGVGALIGGQFPKD